MVEALLVIDEKARALLIVERAAPPHLATRFFQRDRFADQLRQRRPCADLVKELRRQAHLAWIFAMSFSTSCARPGRLLACAKPHALAKVTISFSLKMMTRASSNVDIRRGAKPKS